MAVLVCIGVCIGTVIKIGLTFFSSYDDIVNRAKLRQQFDKDKANYKGVPYLEPPVRVEPPKEIKPDLKPKPNKQQPSQPPIG